MISKALSLILLVVAATLHENSALTLRQRVASMRTKIVVPFIAASLTLNSLEAPEKALAVELGSHTTCAYPACTSQAEILQANAPGLIPKEVKDEQVQLLKDVKFVLMEFPKLVEAQDYATIRASLRAQPASSLRITSRKVKTYMDKAQSDKFMTAYKVMIDKVDDVDSVANKRQLQGLDDKKLMAAVDAALKSYDDFIETIVLSEIVP
jgi:hypothetical protein